MSGDQSESRWTERLRERGLRVTPARLEVVRALEASRRPCSAVEVHTSIGGASIDRVTLYRTLHALVEAGLATKNDPGDRVWRFALAEDEHAAHAHLVCETCGSVTCVDEATVSAAPRGGAKRRRFRLAGRGAMLHGTCEACLGD